MKVRSKEEPPYKLRVFEDGRIKSRGLLYLPKSEYAKCVETLKTCLDCNSPLDEYKPYKYKCPKCNETFSSGFNTLQRDATFYERHPEYM